MEIKDKETYNNLKKFLETGNYKYINVPIKKDIKIGRNELCYCGSGKKYKKCCGRNCND